MLIIISKILRSTLLPALSGHFLVVIYSKSTFALKKKSLACQILLKHFFSKK